MLVEEKSVVTIDLQLFAEDGRLVENLKDYEFIQGINDVLPGMAAHLQGSTVGDKVQAQVLPEEAFGAVRDFEPITYPKEAFGKIFPQLYIGLGVPFETAEGTSVVLYIKDLTSTSATLTINHPLAGQKIIFEAAVTGIRAATDEEVAQGSPKAPGGGSSCSCC